MRRLLAFIAILLVSSLFASALNATSYSEAEFKAEIEKEASTELLPIRGHPITAGEVEESKSKIGVKEEGKNYNFMINGHGTGLAPPSEAEWNAMMGKVRVDDLAPASRLSAPAAFDLSSSPFFPAVGDQGSQGSCSAWAITYYGYGYQEAFDNGWVDLTTGNDHHLMSPAWTYNLVNGGEDVGSSMEDNGLAIACWGVPTMESMPYDEADFLSWGNDIAFREAPLHRAAEMTMVPYDAPTVVSTIKSLVEDGIPVSFAIDASELDPSFDGGKYIVTAAEYASSMVNHAQTIVGWDDAISEDGDVGAFRVVNSWGSSWGDDGYYWITYNALKEIGDLLSLTYVVDVEDYQPSALAVWHLISPPSRDASIVVSVGDPVIDYRECFFVSDPHEELPGFMCLDATELRDDFDSGFHIFNISVADSSISGNITDFHIELYDSGYSPGRPTRVSSHDDQIYATNPGTIGIELNDYSTISLDQALDEPSLDFSSEGAACWTPVDTIHYEGGYSAQSGDITYNRASWLNATVEGEGTIYFKWKVSCWSINDKLSFVVNGIELDSISGIVDWSSATFDLEPGSNHISWKYSTDGTVEMEANCGWVDGISLVMGPPDHTDPEVTILQPFSGSMSSSKDIVVSWNGFDVGSGIEHYEIKLDDGGWTPTGMLTSFTLVDMDQGDHTIHVRAFDAAENIGVASTLVIIDSISPSIDISLPADQSVWNTSEVTIDILVSDAHALLDSAWIDGFYYINGTGLDIESVVTLPDGTHNLHVRSTDMAGNQAFIDIEFTVDAGSPAVEMLSPSNGGWLNTSEVFIAWTGDDAVSVERYEASVDGASFYSIGKATTLHLDDLADGAHILTIKAFDLGGNSALDSVEFTIDTIPVEMTSSEPTRENVSIDSVISVTFSSDLNPESVVISLRNDDGFLAGNWSMVGEGMIFTPSTALSYGTGYSVEVSASDMAGNEAIYDWTFRTISLATLSAIVTGDDGTPISNATILVDGVAVSFTNSSGAFSCDLVPGIHNVTVYRHGYGNLSFDVTVGPGEEKDIGPIELSSVEKSFDMLPAMAITVAVVCIAAAALIMKRRKK